MPYKTKSLLPALLLLSATTNLKYTKVKLVLQCTFVVSLGFVHHKTIYNNSNSTKWKPDKKMIERRRKFIPHQQLLESSSQDDRKFVVKLVATRQYLHISRL